MSRSDEVTRLVAHWARLDPVHGPRLRKSAEHGADQLERAVWNLLRYGGGIGAADSKLTDLRRQLSVAEIDLVDWRKVVRHLLTQ